ncbi:MAG: hypothetical protein ACHQDD_08795 [Steroidobacterales bacterium]
MTALLDEPDYKNFRREDTRFKWALACLAYGILCKLPLDGDARSFIFLNARGSSVLIFGAAIASVGFFVERRRLRKVWLSTAVAEHQRQAAEDRAIVSAYADALRAKHSIAADASSLPYPKKRIKRAILFVLATSSDPAAREQLRSAYVSLADWQEGIGPGPYAFDITPSDVEHPRATAERIAAAGPVVPDIPARIAAETKVLLDELKAEDCKR